MDGEHAEVEGIHVEQCILNATQNGARIKTWQVKKFIYLGIKKSQ